MTTEYRRIKWYDSYHFSQKIILGTAGQYYEFHVDWNTRSESWAVSIVAPDHSIIVQNKKMVLQRDLLDCCYSPWKPNCVLYPEADDINVERITKDNMLDNTVKLYHIVVY